MRSSLHVLLLLVGLALSCAAVNAQRTAESRNVVLVGHNDLNGQGDGGEGLALQQFPDGRRILYLAHQRTCGLQMRFGRGSSNSLRSICSFFRPDSVSARPPCAFLASFASRVRALARAQC